MNTPKRQHIIPCMHLRHFTGADPEGHVWNYDALSARRWSATPENTAVEGHFYSGERADGTMDTTIEELFAGIENLAMPTYEGLLHGEIPNRSQERMNFAHFLGVMHCRTRVMRRMAAETAGRFKQIMLYANAKHPDAFDRSVRDYERELGRQLTLEEREDTRRAMLDPSGYEFTIPKEETFAVIPAADQLAPIFFEMRWWTFTAVAGFFITSDNPLVRWVDPDTCHAIYGDHGFLNKTVEVTFPLSPRKLLLMCWSAADLPEDVGQEFTRHANMIRASQSDQFLYAHQNDDEIARLAAEFRDSRPTMTTQGFGPRKFGPVRLQRRREK